MKKMENEVSGEGLVMNINAEAMMGLVIISIVALIMIMIGVNQMIKKEEPVGFYNVIDPPKKEDISDIVEWNKQHGILWIIYGICIEAGYWLGYFMPITAMEILFTLGGTVFPLPLMILRHRILVKKYWKN